VILKKVFQQPARDGILVFGGKHHLAHDDRALPEADFQQGRSSDAEKRVLLRRRVSWCCLSSWMDCKICLIAKPDNRAMGSGVSSHLD
jgi:hypothetical protein